MAYKRAVVTVDRRAREATGNPIIAAGESVLSAELLEHWRKLFGLPQQAAQVAVYARLGLVADLAGGKGTP